MAADVLQILLVATLGSSAAVALVLLLRKPLRWRFGASAAYALWAAVPLAIVAALVPAPIAVVSAPAASVDVVQVARAGASAARPSPRQVDPRPLLAAAWLAGVAAFALVLTVRQRRYVRALGTLSPIDARTRRAQTSAGCPALVGAWRPRVVVPADFETRFNAAERALILAHEDVHRARGDAQTNLVAAALRCVFWFNPLLHFATSRFRFDQELACDAAVLTRFPAARRAYAAAMLKTQLPGEADLPLALPIGCSWQAIHPLKERIAMLKRPLPHRRRRLLGTAGALVLAIVGSYAAWAAQPSVARADLPESIRAEVVLSVDGAPLDHSWNSRSSGLASMIHDAVNAASTWHVGLKPDEPFSIAIERSGERWELAGAVHMIDAASIEFEGVVRHGESVVSKPSVVVIDGRTAELRIGDQSPDGFKGLGVQMTLAHRGSPVAAAPAAPVQRPAETRNDRPASYRSMRRIAYPAPDLAAGTEGVVYVRVHLGADGTPSAVRATSIPADAARMARLAGAAVAGVKTWTFNPAERAGKPVASDEVVPIVFSLRPDRVPAVTAGTLDAIRVSPPDEARAESVDRPPSEDVAFRQMHPPRYPPEAVREKLSANLRFKVFVDEHGTPQSVDVDSSDPPEAARVFAQASIEAIMQWRFNPGLQDGRPQGGYVLVPIAFALSDE